MADSGKAYQAILKDVLDEYGSRLSVDGGSKVLVSDINIARALYEASERVRTPYGPTITIASRSQSSADTSNLPPSTESILADDLKMDTYTHAVYAVSNEDPKYVLQALKIMKYAMQPKGYAIIIGLRQQTGQSDSGDFVVDIVDKMKYQSKGKITEFKDILEYADFERGKIRSFERKTKVGDVEVTAEVVLAQVWDQLTG